VVGRLAAAVSKVAGARLLDRSSDPDHNRSVFTLAGEPGPLERALLGLYAATLAEIDLARHDGVHPRLGAVDVVPFVPLAGARMADAVTIARRLAAEVARRFELPVYLYGEAASDPARARLADLRRGGTAGLAERMVRPEWRPDFGPARVHPAAGVTAIGARFFLVAFNALLDTPDARVARRIARRVRASSGGLPAVQAIGLHLPSRALAQVSMNLVDYRRTSIPAALAAVEAAARELGAAVVSTEIVGMAPAAALAGASPEELKLEAFGPDRILESALRAHGVV